MNSIVKIITDDDGELTYDNSYHLVIDIAGGLTAFCTGEYFGEGESGCEYEVKKGKITCQKCINPINKIKALKL